MNSHQLTVNIKTCQIIIIFPSEKKRSRIRYKEQCLPLHRDKYRMMLLLSQQQVTSVFFRDWGQFVVISSYPICIAQLSIIL